MEKKHQKHAKLARPDYGEFHRQEWAIIGATCGRIQELSAKLIAALQEHYQLAYVDADHAAGDEAEQIPVAGSTFVYTDKINYHQYVHSGSDRGPELTSTGTMYRHRWYCLVRTPAYWKRI